MYTLRALPYLDKPTGNYLTVLAVDNVPDSMKPWTRQIQPFRNSPFEEPSTSCCSTIMVDKDYTASCNRNRVYPSTIANDFLQLCDLPHAVRLWYTQSYTLDKTLYKVLHENDPKIVAVFV